MSSAPAQSPKMQRYNRTTENGETESRDGAGPRTGRVGLSDYTSQRLAELRARRQEQIDGTTDYKSSRSTTVSTEKDTSVAVNSSPTSTNNPTNSTSTSSDYLEGYRSRRAAAAAASSPIDTSPTGSTSSTTSGKSYRDYSSSNKDYLSSGSAVATRSASTASEFANSRPEVRAVNNPGSTSSLGRSASMRVHNENDDEYVGFASLPEQVHRKAVKRGFDFTLMVVGESGLGKSTLVSSLFLNPELYQDRILPDSHDRVSKTVEIEKKSMDIEERGVKLRLTVVDTPGFNDSINGEQCWKPIEDYILSQFEQYFKDESGLNRKNIKDNRVHCCLYFVSPYGHGLRQVDIQLMKRLHDKVNIVLVIGKADTLTPREIKELKEKVLEEIDRYGIRSYEFPDCDSDEDEEFKEQDKELKAATPFAVIGSNTLIEVNGKKVRGRMYPWGIVEVENPEHCDFSKLRQFLISTHMQDLKEVTRDIHYENYRAKHIKEQMGSSSRERNSRDSKNDSSKYIMSRSLDESKLKRESTTNFDAIVEHDKLLEQKDQEIIRMRQMLAQMQAQLESSNKHVNGLGNL